jgi:hypothetical protein
MKKITVYSGETVQAADCGYQLHPVGSVKYAMVLIHSDKDEVVHTNSPDMVAAIKYIGKKHNVETEFFLDGVSHGDNIEPLFEDFNRALDMVNEHGATE